MKMRPLAALPMLAALVASALATTNAAAQTADGTSAAPPGAVAPPGAYPPGAAPPGMYPPGAEPQPTRRDRPRFRGGIAAEVGSLIAPGAFSVGVAGIQGQLGVQINDMIGVYAVPNFDIVFGKVGGVNLSFAVLVDFTLDDTFTVGIGPDTGAFAAIGGSSSGLSEVGGALYGARLHFSWNPIVSHEVFKPRRNALSIGADLRLLGGGAGFVGVSNAGTATTASASTFVISPQFTIGYTAF